MGRAAGLALTAASDRGIGGAEEVMGKEVLEQKGPVELPW